MFWGWQAVNLYPGTILGLDPISAACAADPDPYIWHCSGAASGAVGSASAYQCHQGTYNGSFYSGGGANVSELYGFISYYNAGLAQQGAPVITMWAGARPDNVYTPVGRVVGACFGQYQMYPAAYSGGYWTGTIYINADNKDDALPLSVWGSFGGSYSSGNVARKGYMTLVRAPAQLSRTTGMRESIASAYDGIVFGQCILPWDSSSAVYA
jgi:hypothetical protein